MTTGRNLGRAIVAIALVTLAIGCSSGVEERASPAVAVSPTLGAAPTTVDPDAAEIVYTDGAGFVPKRLDIEPGTQVRFVNASDKKFWPASNIHPTHAILPELDPAGPIPPGETWAFTFKTRGFWRYHNHLAPEASGLVVVLGKDAGPPADPLVVEVSDIAFESPKDISAETSVALMKDDALLLGFLKRYGPKHTLGLVKESEKHIGGDCHHRAHVLGRMAYEEFGAAAFALSGHECQAGSLHGATEALFASRGTANLEQDVAALCAGTRNSFFRHQCTHGVGHGLMAWTSYEIHDALRLCDRMPSETDKASCHSGVFMENVVGGLTGLMGHVTQYLKPDDPHFPCDVVGERYEASCYFFQTSYMLRVFNRDFAKVARACTEAPPHARSSCFGSYGRDVGGVTRRDPARAILYCGYVPAGPHRVGCIEGAAQDRFWEEAGADAALEMCAMVENAADQDACYTTIIHRARDVFETTAELDGFCARIAPRWRSWCASRGEQPLATGSTRGS